MRPLLNRRRFLQTSALATVPLIVPQLRLFGADAPSNRLNLALIGTFGRAHAFFTSLETQNVTALCDVDEKHLAAAKERFPAARTYVDWRKLLDDHRALALDGVVVCTPDHTHAAIAIWAMNRGLHVYCEKPLANTVEEARAVRAVYLKNKDKLATQTGTQRHALPNFNRVSELVRDGAVGNLKNVYAWGNRKLPRPGYLPAEGTPPDHLHYDLWLGPSAFHPYNPGYFSGGPGLNCLNWNMYWDFGNGQVGDMGSHTMDLAWKAIDAGLPTSATAKGDPFNPEVSPVQLEMTFEHPANSWRGPITVGWYQGGAMPPSPRTFIDLGKIDHGVMFKGDRGFLIADFNSRTLIPFGDKADLTYYSPRKKDEVLPNLGDFMGQWFAACRGQGKTSCDFEYGSQLIEQMLVGLVAYRAGAKVDYDGANGRITNLAEANAFLSRPRREGWALNG